MPFETCAVREIGIKISTRSRRRLRLTAALAMAENGELIWFKDIEKRQKISLEIQ